MNKSVGYLLFLAVYLTGCMEQIENINGSFVKSYGGELQSIGYSVKEIGDSLFILGNSQSASMNILLERDESKNDAIINAAPYLAVVDLSGELLFERLYPIDSIIADVGKLKPIETASLTGINVIEGGYLVTGILPQSSISIPVLGVEGLQVAGLPFFLVLDDQFKLLEIISPNGNSGWDGVGRTDATVWEMSEDQKLILYEGSGYPEGIGRTANTWFSYQTMDKNGNLGVPVSIVNASPNSRIWNAYGLVFDDDAHPITLTVRQEDNALNGIELTKLNVGTNSYESFVIRAPRPEESVIDINGTLLLPSDEGYAVFCNCPGSNDFMVTLNKNFDVIDSLGLSQLTGIRRIYGLTASDGNFVIVGSLNSQDIGRISKITPDGEVLWEDLFSGFPRSVIETSDGGYLVLTNPLFFGLNRRATLLKYTSDGKL